MKISSKAEVDYRKNRDGLATIRDYVLDLYNNQHFLEAQYFHEQLKKKDPDGLETNRIGYRLALAVVNTDVREFNTKLVDAGATEEQIFSLHIQYCLTFNDANQLRGYLEALLGIKPTEQYTVDVVLAALQKHDDADFITKFAQNYLPAIQKNPEITRMLKRMLYARILSVVKAHKKS